ncbi:TIGR02285 family protein [Bdellovibrio sp. 22V]|uniref:TIGR02285 family protein n=1 Tax=Bdellovibrio sp. 22V TaxID=3044166 RepID=UPI0025426F5B|nr:TIGR02285 family protein [Bdellovibrio sp. 22V]WII71564.1 TIGR02285 family protein [Bdellovibrio sp. 22V]
MKPRTAAFFILGLAFLGMLGGSLRPAAAEPKPAVIPWAITEWPPYYIVKGPYAGEGTIDRLKRLLQNKMPGYAFEDVKSDSARIVDLWREGKNVCGGAMLKTAEREKLAYFTALAFSLPHRYVLVTSRPQMLDELGSFTSLQDVLHNRKWKAVIVKDRSYGPLLDKIIHDNESLLKENHFYGKFGEGYWPVLKMIHKGRYDYTVEFPVVVRSFNEEVFPEKPLLSITLKEEAPSFVYYVACTKNEWGRKIIKAVDKVMQELASTEEYHKVVESWLEPAALKSGRKDLNEFYKKRAKGPWTTAP